MIADDRLNLLLAEAGEQRSVLEAGLPAGAAERGPKPKGAGRGAESFLRRRTDGDPNDLPAQRWGIVAPEGREGDMQLDAIAPLVRLREEEQGARARIYRVPPDMDTRRSTRWKEDVYWSEAVPEEERPLYLLMLGDLHQTSIELQHVMANGALVGRVHFAGPSGETRVDGYASYAEKVDRLTRRSPADSAPDLLFYVTPDGSPATVVGRMRLVAPGVAASRERLAAGKLPASSVREVSAETVDALLVEGAGSRPAVLLSVGRGLGAPKRTWRAEEDRRRLQGSLVIDRDEILDADRIRGRSFLPGGVWFNLACFGAGTPATSIYHVWLSQLAREGAFTERVGAVLDCLPGSGQRPFVAALPQAALENPAGPLAVIGHVDLAWTHGFSGAADLAVGRKSRILSAIDVLVRGGRAGVAIEALMRFYREANDALAASYQMEADALAAGAEDPTDRTERGHLWMLRNDLRGYVLLGDPAARLPIGETAQLAAPASPPLASLTASASPPLASLTAPASLTEAVIAMLRGDEAPRIIAERAGVSLDTLFDRVEAYRAAKRP